MGKLELSWRAGNKKKHETLCQLASESFEILKETVKPAESAELKGSEVSGSNRKIICYEISEPIAFSTQEVCSSWTAHDCKGPSAGHSDSHKLVLKFEKSLLRGWRSFSESSGFRRNHLAYHDRKVEGYWLNWDFEAEGFNDFSEPAGILYGFVTANCKRSRWMLTDRDSQQKINDLLDTLLEIAQRKTGDVNCEWQTGKYHVIIQTLHRDQDLHMRVDSFNYALEARADALDHVKHGWELLLPKRMTYEQYKRFITKASIVIEEMIGNETVL